MIHIFQVDDKVENITEYIVKHLARVCDNIGPDDIENITYLEMAYYRVMDDRRIKPEDRSLLCILDKIEEDLLYDQEIFGKRAEFILHFFELDLLRAALSSNNNLEELKLLGRVRALKLQFFPHAAPEKNGGELTPSGMKKYIDQYVIEQEQAKKAVCLAVYRHKKMVKHPGDKFAPNVVLLVGPSGCGKTEIMRRIHEITDEPMICTDVSSLGASQYRGRHKEDLLISLWEASGRKKSLAERGIIFMDEFDKILLPAYSERGVNVHDDVQSQLLTMLEGSDVELKVNGRVFTMNTSKILFVLAGAFQGIEECIHESYASHGNQSGFIGFSNPLKNEVDTGFEKRNITHEILMNYGMKRELAGRISDIAVLKELNRKDLLRILKDSKDNLPERYAREVRLACGAELEFTEEALDKIVDMALEEKTGARALHHLVRRAVRTCLYQAPDRKDLERIIITKEVVTGAAEPDFLLRQEGTDWKSEECDEETL